MITMDMASTFTIPYPCMLAFLKVLGCDFVDELAGFEEEWEEKGQKYLPGWTGSVGE